VLLQLLFHFVSKIMEKKCLKPLLSRQKVSCEGSYACEVQARQVGHFGEAQHFFKG